MSEIPDDVMKAAGAVAAAYWANNSVANPTYAEREIAARAVMAERLSAMQRPSR